MVFYSDLTYIATVDWPGCEKTTVSFISVFMLLGQNLQFTEHGGLQYYSNENIFYGGRNTSDLSTLSTYHVCNAQELYKEWLSSAAPAK